MTTSPDIQLTQAVLAGDEQAFNQFFDEQYPRLYRFVLARSADAQLAEELAQAVLCMAVEKLPTYRGEAALSTWLFTICRNRMTDLARKGDIAPTVEPPFASFLESISDEGADPDQLVESQELAAKVQLVLDHLPPQYAQVLQLKYAREYSMKQIATRMKTTAKAVESMLSRARQSFRQTFSEVL